MTILIMMTVDQGIISTAQLERQAEEELSADWKTAVDEIPEHSWPSRSFPVVRVATTLSPSVATSRGVAATL
jgi:hypothetical protein